MSQTTIIPNQVWHIPCCHWFSHSAILCKSKNEKQNSWERCPGLPALSLPAARGKTFMRGPSAEGARESTARQSPRGQYWVRTGSTGRSAHVQRQRRQEQSPRRLLGLSLHPQPSCTPAAQVHQECPWSPWAQWHAGSAEECLSGWNSTTYSIHTPNSKDEYKYYVSQTYTNKIQN